VRRDSTQSASTPRPAGRLLPSFVTQNLFSLSTGRLPPTELVLLLAPIYCVYMSCHPVLDILDILDIVQTCPSCPTCPQGAIQNNLQKLRGFESAKFGTIIACAKTGVRADPDSSRQERLVAIASVALPKRECGRSLKPRSKRGVWECAMVKGTRQAGRRDGRASQRSWGVCSQRTPRHHEAQKVENLSRLGGCSERTRTHHMAKEWASQRSWGCASVA
jgi:hypothetical protein